MDLASCLYECRVMHHRFHPRVHRFSYRIFMFHLDLDELEEINGRFRLFSYRKSNLYTFRDEDHLLFGASRLKEGIGNFVRNHGRPLSTDKVFLLTLPRVFGHIFNPVSFYFCQNREGAPSCAIAEVGNTFAERKPFLITERGEGRGANFVWRERRTKYFYVSPFFDHDLDFDFNLRIPGESLAVQIDNYKGEERQIHTTLTGKRRELTDRNLLSLTARFPLVTLKVIAGIHWEALKLWRKGISYRGKQELPELQRDVHFLEKQRNRKEISPVPLS